MIPALEVTAIRDNVDLCALIGRDVALRRESVQSYCGPCPWCAGRDRFVVKPEEGRWFCRRCLRKGDAIEYVREREGVTFMEALRALGATLPHHSLKRAPEARREPSEAPPSRAWLAAALAAVERAEEALWSPAGGQARGYLLERGLREETLRAWRVGFTHGGIVEGLRLPGPAVVLPWFIEGDPWALKLRMLEANPSSRRYLWGAWADGARGAVDEAGTAALYCAPGQAPAGRPLVLVEGELDAMLLWQEVGDLAEVATLGSATVKLRPQSRWLLRTCSRLLVAYDADEAGERGAAEILKSLGRARRASSPAAPPGKDITDAHRQGVDLRAWLAAALAAAYPDEATPAVAPPRPPAAVLEGPSSTPLEAPPEGRPPSLLRYTPGVTMPPVSSSTYHTYPEYGGTGSNLPGTSWLSQAPGGTVRMAPPAPGEDATEADALARRLAHYRTQAARLPMPPMRWDPELPPGFCFTCGTRPAANTHRTRCDLCEIAFLEVCP